MRLAVVGGPLPMTARPEGDFAFGCAGAFGEEACVGVSTLDGLGALGLVGGRVGAGSFAVGVALATATFGASTEFGVSTIGLGGGGMLVYPFVAGAFEVWCTCEVAGDCGCDARASYGRGVALYGLGET